MKLFSIECNNICLKFSNWENWEKGENCEMFQGYQIVLLFREYFFMYLFHFSLCAGSI